MDRVLLTAAAAVAIAFANGAAPDWVQLFPAQALKGEAWTGRDGRGPYKLTDLAGFMKQTCSTVTPDGKTGQCDLLLDYDHQTDLPEARGFAKIAAGWIKQIQIREDGIYGQIDWTESASKAVAGREYRFVSPVFLFRKADGDIAQLLRASLTNNPNFIMKAVASRDVAHPEDSMDFTAFLALIRSALNLKADADATACQAAVTAAVASAKRVDALDALVKAIAAKLGVKPEATATEFETAIASLSTAATGTTATDQTIIALQKQVNDLLATNASRSAEELVDTAMKVCKVSPAAKDWAIDYAKRDPEGFKKFLETAPVLVGATAIVPGQKPGADATGFASAEEAAVAKQLGLTAEQFKKGA